MRRAATFLLASVLVLGAAACSSGDDGGDGDASSTSAAGDATGGTSVLQGQGSDTTGAATGDGSASSTQAGGSGASTSAPAAATTTRVTAPPPVLGRPIDDGTGLRVGYVPAEYGLAGVQGWPFDAQEGRPRQRTLFLNGPGGQVDVIVARDTEFSVPGGASEVRVQGRAGYATGDPQNTVAFTPEDGVILTVTSSGLSIEELTRMAEELSYDPSKDGLPEQ